ncbi:MAG: hypothetical protein QOF63_400, partial [Thermoanaerobaculia bacterium]|nr:hypothetical protein [Thermoanaerobaculia bacterium]
MAKARHSKSTDCTTCSNKSGFPLEGDGF